LHILITYEDGTTEQVTTRLEGECVSQGGELVPGHSVLDPKRCHFKADYFECALDEAGETSGAVAPDGDGAAFESFRWELVGTDADACREKLEKWVKFLNQPFDPLERADRLGFPFTDQQERIYRRDSQCWTRYLDDPREEVEEIARRLFPAPRS